MIRKAPHAGGIALHMFRRDERRPASIAERLERLSIPEPNSGCLLWLGRCNDAGYGSVRHDGHMKGAHRVAYELAHGPIPQGHFVCHRCDVPSCVNPKHLFAGRPDQNSADMVRKGRSQRGSERPHAKLSERQALCIRADQRPRQVIADAYGVSYSVVRRIKEGKRWRHAVAPPPLTPKDSPDV